MTIPKLILDQLSEQSIAYETMEVSEPLDNVRLGQSLKEDSDKLLRAVALKDQSRSLLANSTLQFIA